VVAQLVAQHLTNLPYDHRELTGLPMELFERAKPMFAPNLG